MRSNCRVGQEALWGWLTLPKGHPSMTKINFRFPGCNRRTLCATPTSQNLSPPNKSELVYCLEKDSEGSQGPSCLRCFFCCSIHATTVHVNQGCDEIVRPPDWYSEYLCSGMLLWRLGTWQRWWQLYFKNWFCFEIDSFWFIVSGICKKKLQLYYNMEVEPS